MPMIDEADRHIHANALRNIREAIQTSLNQLSKAKANALTQRATTVADGRYTQADIDDLDVFLLAQQGIVQDFAATY